MKTLKYNRILDGPPENEAPAPGTLTVRLEGNIGEDCPSDMHRYEISVPAEVGVYTVDFSSYAPKHVYELRINGIGEDGADIRFGEKDFTLHGGKNLIFTEKVYQASYDGPWFTGIDEIEIICPK